MTSIRVTEIKKGMAVVIDGELFVVTKHEHVTPGNWRAIHHVHMKGVKSGQQKYQRMGSSDTLEVAYLDAKRCQYLYKDATGYVFMDEQTYDQFHMPEDVVGDLMSFIKENDSVTVTFHEELPISFDLGSAVVLEVVEAEDAVKGNTATNVTKNATTETGMVVKVPLHIKVGDKIKVSTEDKSFLGRVNE